MTIDSSLLIAFMAVFLRTSAVMLASPILGGAGIPVMVRVFFCAILGVAIAPTLQGAITVPVSLYDLALMGALEVGIGLIIGGLVHLIISSAQIAGSFLDLQVGFGIGALFAPNQMLPNTVISRYKFMTALVLFVVLNGHHLLIHALTQSYHTSAHISSQLAFDKIMIALWEMSLIALQIALPVAAVAFTIDACLGIVARAVPQINVLIAGLPAKLMAGLIALSLTVPVLAIGVNKGIDVISQLLQSIFR